MFGVLSIIATFSLLCFLVFRAVKARASSRRDYTHQTRTQGFFWLVNLFIAGWFTALPFLIIDFLQGIGIVLDLYEVSNNSAVPGNGCNAQGLFLTLGDVSSAWWTLIIALHTFLVIAGGPNIRGYVAEKSVSGKERWILCFSLWFAVLFLSTVGMFLIQNINPANGPFCID